MYQYDFWGSDGVFLSDLVDVVGGTWVGPAERSQVGGGILSL